MKKTAKEKENNPGNVGSIAGAANKNVSSHKKKQNNTTHIDRQVKADTAQPR
jgi:hypothetical protein